MGLFVSAAFFVLGQIAPAATFDKTALREIVEAAYSPIGDLTFEYEGMLVYNTKKARERLKIADDGVYLTYSGVFAYRADGAIFMEVYQRISPSNDITKEQNSILHGKLAQVRKPNDQASSSGLITDASTVSLVRTGSALLIFSIPDLKRMLNEEDVAFVDRGVAQVDGRDCREFDCYSKRSLANQGVDQATNFTGQRLWIDLERGCQVLKKEFFSAGTLVSRTVITLSKRSLCLPAALLWLPLSGVLDGFAEADAKGQIYFAKTPQNTETIKMMLNTLEINKSLSDDKFNIKFKVGTLVSDNLKSLKYEFGQQKEELITRKEADRQVADQLQIAEEQRDELRARSWERRGLGLWETVPWVLGVSLLALALVLMYKERQNRRR